MASRILTVCFFMIYSISIREGGIFLFYEKLNCWGDEVFELTLYFVQIITLFRSESYSMIVFCLLKTYKL